MNLLLLFAITTIVIINFDCGEGFFFEGTKTYDLEVAFWKYFHLGDEEDRKFDEELSQICAQSQSDKKSLDEHISEINRFLTAHNEELTDNWGRPMTIFRGEREIFQIKSNYINNQNAIRSLDENLPVCQPMIIRLLSITRPYAIHIERNVIITKSPLKEDQDSYLWLVVAPVRKGYFFLDYDGNDPIVEQHGARISGFGSPGYFVDVYVFDLRDRWNYHRENPEKKQIQTFKYGDKDDALQKEVHKKVLESLPMSNYFDIVEASEPFFSKDNLRDLELANERGERLGSSELQKNVQVGAFDQSSSSGEKKTGNVSQELPASSGTYLEESSSTADERNIPESSGTSTSTIRMIFSQPKERPESEMK